MTPPGYIKKKKNYAINEKIQETCILMWLVESSQHVFGYHSNHHFAWIIEPTHPYTYSTYLEVGIHMIFVSHELSSVRDYVITHSVRSMYVVCT